MGKQLKRRRLSTKAAGIAVLVVLCAVAAGVYIKQFDFNPAVTEVRDGLDLTAEGGDKFDLSRFIPDSLVPFGPPESFDSGTLSEKINGKAELYFKADFEQLHCRRFAPQGARQKWVEVFVYDMGEARNAFAVFSQQRRRQAQELDLADNAYRTSNAVYFTRGPYYVEVVATAAEDELIEPAIQFARNFASQIGGGSETNEKELFPAKGLQAKSISLIPDDAFGFSQMDNIVTADYTFDSKKVMGFVSVRNSSAVAEKLAKAYAEFLIENGGSAEEMENVSGAIVIKDLFDMYEVVFARGNILAGVHQAPDKATAEKLAKMLSQQLEQAGR